MEFLKTNKCKRKEKQDTIQADQKTIEQEDKLNRTIKKCKFDDLHFNRQSHEALSQLNLPRLIPIKYKTAINIFEARNQNMANQNLSHKIKLNQNNLPKDLKKETQKTIFSNELRNYQKGTFDAPCHINPEKNQRQSHSISSKSSSLKKISFRKQKVKTGKITNFLNIEGQKIQAKDSDESLTLQNLTNKNHRKKNIKNRFSAIDKIQDKNKQSKKDLTKQRCQLPKIKQKRSLTTDKNERILAQVESGIEIIRQLKLKRARQLISQGEISRAIQALNRLIQVDSNDIEVMYMLAELSFQQRKNELANKYLKLIVLNQASSFKYDQQILKIKALVSLQRYEEAIEKVETVQLKLETISIQEKFELLKIKGFLHTKINLLENALEYLEEAQQILMTINHSSQESELFQFIGQIYFQFKMYKKALSYFQKSMQTQGNKKKQGFKLTQKMNFCLENIPKMQTKKSLNKQIISPEQNFIIPKISYETQLPSIVQEFESKLSTSDYLQAYKILVTNEHGRSHLLESLCNQNKESKILDLAQSLKNIGFQKQALQIYSLQNSRCKSLQAIEQTLKLNYKQGNFEKCYDQIKNYVELSSKLRESLKIEYSKEKDANSSLKIERQIQISEGLSASILKIKQLDTELIRNSDLQKITKRRNHNIGEAIKLFQNFSLQTSFSDSNKIRALSVIGEQSTISIVKNEDRIGNQNQLHDTFALKQIREIFSIWNTHLFSIQSMNELASKIFNLTMNEKSEFSILPLHIIAYTMKMKQSNSSFYEINRTIKQKLNELCKLYPPSEKSVTQSQLKQFQIDWINKEKVDLFDSKYIPNDYRQILSRIEKLSRIAFEEKPLMDEKCKQICDQFKGQGYKSNLKLPITSNYQHQTKKERSYCRILEKILSKELEICKDQYLQTIDLSKQLNAKQIFLSLNKNWEITINRILKQKRQNKQHTPCYVYDFMRAKCMFNSIKNIDSATEAFISGHKKGQYNIIEIDNRLNNKTKDVVLKIQFKSIVGQIQLALKFESQKNEFNHSLYELSRSPFGSVFASFMWFTGFANQDESKKLIVNEKLNWSLKRMQHLRKFIYQDKIVVCFKSESKYNILKRQFNSEYLILQDFVVSPNSIQGYLMVSNGAYLQIQIAQSLKQQSIKQIRSLEGSSFTIPAQSKPIFRLATSDRNQASKFKLFFEDKNQLFTLEKRYTKMRIQLSQTSFYICLLENRQNYPQFVLTQTLDEAMQYDADSLNGQVELKQLDSTFEIDFLGFSLESIQKLTDNGPNLVENDKKYHNQINETEILQKSISQVFKIIFNKKYDFLQ